MLPLRPANNPDPQNCGCGPAGCGTPGPTRRDVIKAIGVGTISLLAAPPAFMAGPFEPSELERLIPADKKLHPDWVRSLFARGTPTILRGRELRFVGMPIGGIGAGQLYLGGDGRLWHWDIFNHYVHTGAEHYERPPTPTAPITQNFELRIGERSHLLDGTGFSDVSFRGEYPIGTVEYRDPAVPLTITLEAFSPFIPLNLADSSLPATILHFTVRNTSAAPVEATLVGALENAVCLYSPWAAARRRNAIQTAEGLTWLDCSVEPTAVQPSPEAGFETWTENAGARWSPKADAPDTFLSREIRLEHPFINFALGAERVPHATTLQLRVGGKLVRTATRPGLTRRETESFDVRELMGQTAQFELLLPGPNRSLGDGVGAITFGTQPPVTGPLADLPDFGTMGLGLLGAAAEFSAGNGAAELREKLIGRVGRKLRLAAGESTTITFVLAWRFPNLTMRTLGAVGREYATRFGSARAVADYVARNFARLAGDTRRWRDTWYQSSLPCWLLERTLANASILASSTSYRFADGRVWGWEGVGCCAGTCTHVWGYAQSAGRLFPELERDLRERTDFGIAFGPTGQIAFRGDMPNRGESDGNWAVDGQAMILLRTLREHQVSPDHAFLRRVWPKAKQALAALMTRDTDADGLLDGAQHNTLDAAWFGDVAWLSGLYLAALRAGEELAREMADADFATRCAALYARGRDKLVRQLFNGDYFINRVDPAHLDAINSGSGCHIDQVLGQSWAAQVGLGRVLPEKETLAALRSLWRFNFAPDVGPYRRANPTGRWYAMAGEAGLLMCTFPRTDWSFTQAQGRGKEAVYAGYFNECMNGFEYQVAGHMIREGLVLEGLAVTRAVHDRYAATRRNPWNEVECGDHYARSMASHGVFLAACGFEYHGPRGHLGFQPRLSPENFRAAFTAAEGWGTFAQKADNSTLRAEVHLAWGQLRLATLAFQPMPSAIKVAVTLAGQPLAARLDRGATGETRIVLSAPCVIQREQTLAVVVS